MWYYVHYQHVTAFFKKFTFYLFLLILNSWHLRHMLMLFLAWHTLLGALGW